MNTLLKITHKLNNKHWQVGIFLSICGHANTTLSFGTTLIVKLYCNLSILDFTLLWWNLKWSHLKGISPLCMITFEGLHYVFSSDKQSTLIGKTFMTLITFIRFLFIEYSLMNYRIIFIGKTLITMFTFKRLLATVCSLMDYKMSYFNKTTITLITLKRLFSTVC